MIGHPPKSPLFPSPPLSRPAESRAHGPPAARFPEHRRDLAIGHDPAAWDATHEPVDEAMEGRRGGRRAQHPSRSEEHTSELQSRSDLVCRLLLEKKKQ